MRSKLKAGNFQSKVIKTEVMYCKRLRICNLEATLRDRELFDPMLSRICKVVLSIAELSLAHSAKLLF